MKVLTASSIGDQLKEANQRLFAWDDDNTVHLIVATNYDEAFRKLIASRLEAANAQTPPTQDDLDNVLGWHEENDNLMEIESYLDIEPYNGTIPDQD